MGAIAPPIPKVEPKVFRLVKLLMCKPKKYFSANQQNCFKEPFLHQPLVQGSQTRGPRATCGSLGHFVRPAMRFGNRIKI